MISVCVCVPEATTLDLKPEVAVPIFYLAENTLIACMYTYHTVTYVSSKLELANRLHLLPDYRKFSS